MVGKDLKETLDKYNSSFSLKDDHCIDIGNKVQKSSRRQTQQRTSSIGTINLDELMARTPASVIDEKFRNKHLGDQLDQPRIQLFY